MVTVGYDVSRFEDDVDEELFCAICGQVGPYTPNYVHTTNETMPLYSVHIIVSLVWCGVVC